MENIKVLKKKAKAGDLEAQLTLGTYYWHKSKFKKALKYFTPLANLNNAEAQFNLFHAYYVGCGVKTDKQKCLHWLYSSAQLGNAEAQLCLAKMYHYGKMWMPYVLFMELQDGEKAYNWCKKSAGQGYEYAVEFLKFIEDSFNKVSKETIEKLMQKANNGDSQSQFKLGYNYLNGFGVYQNYNQAIKYFTLSALANNTDAIYQLACCYFDGFAGEENCKKGLEFLKRGMELGDAKCFTYMAYNHEYGDFGVEFSHEKAFELRKKGAELGDMYSQLELANYYLLGISTDIDKEKAIYWLNKAVEQGSPEAKDRLENLDESLQNIHFAF